MSTGREHFLVNSDLHCIADSSIMKVVGGRILHFWLMTAGFIDGRVAMKIPVQYQECAFNSVVLVGIFLFSCLLVWLIGFCGFLGFFND